MARVNAFWPTAEVGEADHVNSVSASACHIGGPKGVSPGQKALLQGNQILESIWYKEHFEIHPLVCNIQNISPHLARTALQFLTSIFISMPHRD